jgi:acyl-coenzyme A thioesterase PaaI-like protein
MISALIGGVIMSAATVAMLLALNFTNKTMKSVGKEPLREEERNILINAGFDFSDINVINQDIESLDFE